MWNVARIGLLSWLVILVSLGSAQQLSNDEAVRLATGYARAVGHPLQGKVDAQLTVGPYATWIVNFGDAMIMMELTGLLASFTADVKSDENHPHRDPFVNDEAAWEFAEDVLAPLGVAEGLHRVTLEREPSYVNLHFGTRPFGYPAMGGNSASVSVRKRDRKVTSLGISRGWSYEAPNIKVTEAQAIATAKKHLKAFSDGWTTGLSYWVIYVPEASDAVRQLYEQRTSRLFYDVWSEEGSVLIDSITGEVATTGRPDPDAVEPVGKSTTILEIAAFPSKIYAHPKYKPIPKTAGLEPDLKTGPLARDPAPEGTNLPLIGGVAVVTGLVGFALARWRRKP